MTFSYTFGIGWASDRPALTPMKGRIIDRIVRDVAARHGVFVGEILGRTRTAQICRARFEAMWLAYQERRADGSRLYTLPFIGRCFGRDHTSVLHAIRRHEAILAAGKVAA